MAFNIVAQGLRPLLVAGAAIAAFTIAGFFLKLYKIRRRVLSLKRQGYPMPPYNPILGHLPAAIKARSKLPKDIHGQHLIAEMNRTMPELGPIFYFDVWPFSAPTLIVDSPSAIRHMTQEHSLPKFRILAEYLDPLTAGKDLVVLEGDQWKKWRGIFNPGFSASHLMTLVPGIVDDVQTFRGLLRKEVDKNEIFSLEKYTLNLAIDVIGRVTMDVNFNMQLAENEFIKALQSQIKWLSLDDESDPLARFNPYRYYIRWHNARVMTQYLTTELRGRAAKIEKTGQAKRSKSIMDLALETYISDRGPDAKNQGLDSTFEEFAMAQIKMFIYAGHDTTSSTVCYSYHLLSKSPTALEKIRAEHDSVFGTDITKTADLINENPHLLNSLPYTLAVIKEALRLFPPASAFRQSEPGFILTDEKGRQFPADGFMLWNVHLAMQRDPAYWPQPDEFIPERWLAAPGDPLYPVKDAWRPFELGLRGCIGQALSLMEMRIVLALTIREFDIRSVYEESDKLKGRTDIRTVNGERAYQVLMGAAHPNEGLPCRISLAKRSV